MTGLAAGWASGLPVYEAEAAPGGICSSYYVRPGIQERLHQPPEDGEAYRFEVGGGHWIFGGDPAVLRFIGRLAPAKTYPRTSSVFFPDRGLHGHQSRRIHRCVQVTSRRAPVDRPVL